jgi:acetate kinase
LKKPLSALKIITCHLGNGCSMTAVDGGRSVDTSMGFTPLEGLVMGTRAGDHDPAIGYYIMGKENLPPKEMEKTLNKGSGILGITEKYTDRRDVSQAAEKGDERARLAIEVEAYRIKKYIGSYLAALGRIDAVVFTAGVGEMNPVIREAALSGLEGLGIRFDPRKNALARTRNAETVISTEASPVKTFVIPTDEELVMTEDTQALLVGSYQPHTRFSYSFQHRDYVNHERAGALALELKERPQLAEVIARLP